MRFDEIKLDRLQTIGSHQFTREAILEFARDFDPQPFHVDDEAAVASPYGGIIASGWHTAAVWMRLTVDFNAGKASAAGISPGIEELSWLKPVRPGDVLTYSNMVTAKRRLASRPGWALITSIGTAVNQSGEEVYRMRGPVFIPIDD